jgi:hypothetical protein
MGQMVLKQMDVARAPDGPETGVPCWVPKSVQNYIDHTEMGVPIRALARKQGCHASTILRQIRRVETLRDDPMVDGALKALGGGAQHQTKSIDGQVSVAAVACVLPEQSELSQHAMRVLRRLCETGAVLAVGADMDVAVIVRDGQSGTSTRTGVVERNIVEAMALQGWIAAPDSGRIARYHITSPGRSALADLMARNENAQVIGTRGVSEGRASVVPRRIRHGIAESPLAALARRRDRDGARFLGDDLVHAGERLREDFELAQMEADVSADWSGFLTRLREKCKGHAAVNPSPQERAHARVIDALRDIGPGLSDVTLRCCCFLEGLETAEKTLGWSARSGKIVLRIALMGLKRHYRDAADPRGAMSGAMIG